MKSYIISICLLFILLYNSACNKNNNEPDSGGTLLSQIKETEQINGNTSVSTNVYSYDTNNKLISVVGGLDSTLFDYDSQGQLLGERYFNKVAGPVYNETFVYDTQGRIIKKTGTSLQANLDINDHSYGYDINNNIIADSVHNGNKPEIISYNVYEYNADGNLSKEYYYSNVNGITQLDTSFEYTYNDRVNPYYQNRLAFYFGLGYDFIALSKNFWIDNSGSNVPKYAYYSNGLPREITYYFTQIGSQSVGTILRDFTYKK